ncbi:PRC-barrel domain-containing protein [Pannonibacter sp. SL95]|uniref:PRC-barrel domain-containing protein n=1 Tax=Pannonibacter sp. SL95 TaxID=2995153 RepID=UPI0022751771|nr:PRC-barrel domain-containing protein [Pannonibacter sp. SL95]MCY1706912.1 PRC-barrel domain-containing protein [Pannonibacter sp. SL95]
MLRAILATTALTAALFTSSAYAQTATTSKSDASSTGSPIFTLTPPAAGKGGVTYGQATAGQILATSLIGKQVFADANNKADSIGTVNDVVLSREGAAEALVIGVGGLLGIGEKDVAVSFDQVRWIEQGGVSWLIVPLTKAQLEAAPSFDRSVLTGPTATEKLMNSMGMGDPKPQAKTSVEVTTSGTTGTVSGSDMMLVDRTTIGADELLGSWVNGAAEAKLGSVSDVLMSEEGIVEAYVVDVGGVLGIGAKPVALAADNLAIYRLADGKLRVDTPFTAASLKDHPAYTAEAYKADPEALLIR